MAEEAAPPARVVLTTISVRGLEVSADIGVNPDEIGRRQPLRIDVTLTVRAVDNDRIEQAVDYREVARHAERLAETRIALIETFARRLAEACLRQPLVIAAEVAVDKPRALANGMAGACVRMARPEAP